MNKKLYRDEYHKVLGGVCSGLAEYFEMDVTVIRLLFAFTVIVMGVGIIPYIVLWIVLPKKGYLYNQYNNPSVDYTVPPQQPAGGQFTAEGNPFGSNPYGANPFDEVPPLKYPQKQKSNAGIIVGVVLIVIGAAVLIDEYDLIPDFDFGRLWPIVLVLVGASLIVSGQQKKPWHHGNWNDAPAADSGIKTESSDQQEPLV
ncbi:phage shock protein C (PspC) family protein [Mucilaginibacter frigoritolerans]|jgi:phage shock protein C|uniref:Phage shock protein C (PspC) family protein n=1 Tax=Mucilaginibacter frigoritolerans TaxID=652788 RepID=A0A562TLY6_9SPHI|nr:PspC domain-containing protein [Mucilaginibacter frigoritolerans]TWI94601.1 phage shock protein C (PspC) family protein [Mucilaginibacter frigoritolerans]